MLIQATYKLRKHSYFSILNLDSLEKSLMLGGIGGQEKGTTEDEMAEWHHWLDGHESEWTPGVGDGQGDLVCCDSRGHKESDTTEQLNWTELNPTANIILFFLIFKIFFLWFILFLKFKCLGQIVEESMKFINGKLFFLNNNSIF